MNKKIVAVLTILSTQSIVFAGPGYGSEKSTTLEFIEDHKVGLCIAATAAALLLSTKSGRPVVIVKNAQAVALERLGKFHKVLTPGLHVKMPFIDVPRDFTWTDKTQKEKILTDYRLDLRERVCSFPPQGVITRDNVRMSIDALVYYRITDPKLALYAIQDLPHSIEAITQTNLRNEVGAMHLDETLTSRDKINTALRNALGNVAQGWGADITRVELQEVTPPEDITRAMAAQMSAERQKRANILEAEGKRAAAILDAEGESLSAIQKAAGQAEATIKLAEAAARATVLKGQAETQALQSIASAGVSPAEFLLAQKYCEALEHVGQGKGNVVVVPYDGASLANLTTIVSKIAQAGSANRN